MFLKMYALLVLSPIIKQLLTFVEVNMFVYRPENPILAEVNIMDIQVCKHIIDRKQKSIIIIVLL